MSKLVLLAALILGLAAAAPLNEDAIVPEFAQANSGVDALPPVEEFHVVGTHNSYKKKPSPYTVGMMRMVGLDLIADSIDYGHDSITDQISQGLDSFEIDIFADPDGGLLYETHGPYLLHPFTQSKFMMGRIGAKVGIPEPQRQATEAGYSAAMKATMSKPGFKVQHIQDIDFNTNCGGTLESCLEPMKGGVRKGEYQSDIWVLLEIKDEKPITGNRGLDSKDGIPWASPKTMNTQLWLDLEDVIKEFEHVHFILDNADLAEAYIKAMQDKRPDAQPLLGVDVRKLDVAKADAYRSQGIRTALVCNDPDEVCYDGKKISDLVKEQKYVIRTRADSGAKAMDYARAKKAMESRAHIVHTDFPTELMPFMKSAECSTCRDGFFVNGHGHSCAGIRAHTKGADAVNSANWGSLWGGVPAAELCVQFKCKEECTCTGLGSHRPDEATCTSTSTN